MSGRYTATLGSEDLQVGEAEVLPRGTVVGGRYELDKPLGSGGYAVVYRAFDRELHGEVALKLLRRDRVSAAALARFRREVNVAREVASPRLVRVYDLGVSDEGSYLTMEIVAGGSLRPLIAARGMPLDAAVRLATQVLEGLAALHALNIVHRDVKPENILVDAGGEVKLADFGLARYLDEEHSRATATGAIVGTSDYLSPEQVLGTAVDARSDLYAFGLVFFEMLTGRRPFPRESSVGAMIARLRTPAPAVRSIRRGVPLWLSSIVGRLLQRQPADRYATAEEVLRALRGRRADLRNAVPWRRVAVALAAAAGLLGAALLAYRVVQPSPKSAMRYSHMAVVDRGTVAAIGARGETLWQRGDVDADAASQCVLARVAANAPPLLAAIFAKRYNYLPDGGRQTLLLLDPDTGQVRRRVALPSPGPLFGYSDRYHVRTVRAVDLDRDGIDEIIVSYMHAPEAPSVVVLYEPKMDRARILFEGEGGHTFAFAQDLDGDGRPELLLMGTNNGFDWINAMAAIRVKPWIGEPAGADNDGIVYSPQMSGWSDANLLWYALLPRGQAPVDSHAFHWDEARKLITIQYYEGRNVVLTGDGFRTDEPSPLAPSRRQDFRNAAYGHYRECLRLLAGEFFDAATDEITKAVDAARNAHDSVLVEAMQRIEGRALILGGRAAEGEALMRRLAATSENASEIAYDTAVAFHLAGGLDRAVQWYENGYGRGAAKNFGKSKHEFIQGIVFALCEKRDWARAEEAMRRFHDSFVYQIEKRDWTAMYGEFIRWRAGQTANVDDLDINALTVDVGRYWKLEFHNQRGDDPAAIMKSVDEEIGVESSPRSGLWSLKAELLSRMGRRADAADAARRAWELSRLDRKSSIVARAHVAIVAERARRLAGVEAR